MPAALGGQVGTTVEVCWYRTQRGGSMGTPEGLAGVVGAQERGAGALGASLACDSGPGDFGTIPATRKNNSLINIMYSIDSR